MSTESGKDFASYSQANKVIHKQAILNQNDFSLNFVAKPLNVWHDNPIDGCDVFVRKMEIIRTA